MSAPGNYQFRRRRVPPHANPLVRRFVDETNDAGIALADIADRAGLNRHTVSAWGYRQDPTLSNFEAALNVVGCELVIRRKA